VLPDVQVRQPGELDPFFQIAAESTNEIKISVMPEYYDQISPIFFPNFPKFINNFLKKKTAGKKHLKLNLKIFIQFF